MHIGYQASDLSCFFLVTENTLVVLMGKKKKKEKEKEKKAETSGWAHQG